MKAYRFSITWPLDFDGPNRSAWTAPADLRCGDLLLLYEAGQGGGRKAIVAIGWAVTDAVRAYRGDRAHWAWVDWRPVEVPLGYADAQRVVAFSVRGPHSEIPMEDFDRLAGALSQDNLRVGGTLERWRAGDGFPRTNEVPLHDLLLASWYVTRGESELDWYDDIAMALRDEGWLPLDDVTRTALRRLRGPLSFDPDGGDRALRPDLTLIRPRSRAALVVEVKLVAVPTRGYRNPTDQVLDYAKAINDALHASPVHGRGWTVQPMLVAGEFSPPVLDAARAARAHNGVGRMACRIWDGARLGPNLLSTAR